MSIGGHQSARMRSDTWLTPPEILGALGSFDLDPCTPEVMPWQTARHRFTVQDDGLAQDWFGRVWLNPPYGREAEAWLQKLVRHGTGTALIFARTETAAFFKTVWNAASALLFLEGRLSFHHADGARATKNAGAPSVLIAYGLDDADILAECGINGAFVPLSCLGQTVFVARHAEALTWQEVIRAVMERQGGQIDLDVAYALIQGHPKTHANRHWKAKVRQTLQRMATRTGPAQYALEDL